LNIFLGTNENLKTDFENEPEPVKAFKKVDEEKLQKLAEKAKGKAIGAKYDEEKNKEEGKEKKKKMEKAKKKQEEEERLEEEEKAQMA
jgi:hypothetical protein